MTATAAPSPAGDVLAPPVVRAYHVSRAFGANRVLRNLDIEVRAGEIVALLGASGCGKTTLLRILAGFDPEATGEITVPDSRAVVYQEHRLLPWRKVWQNAAIGLTGPSRRQRVVEMLDQVGLADRADVWPSTLSGGQAARVALARALVREPQLLLLDEPFASLDALTRLKMHALLSQLWQRHHPATIMVTHDVDEAATLADRVLVMAEGRILDDVRVELPHPRRRSDPAVEALRLRLLALLGVDDAV
jgi:sulfonate transport system ATP-binding protein